MAFMEDSQRNFVFLFPFVLNSLSLLYYYTYKRKGRRKMKDKIQIGEGFPRINIHGGSAWKEYLFRVSGYIKR